MRIASLLPSATEIVCALGAEAELVGRSAECDFPPSVHDLPILMRSRFDDTEQPSEAIDARVTEARARGESLYRLDIPGLSRLKPDVLLTQDLCGVCSVTGDEVRTACAAAGVDPEILSLSPQSVDQVLESIDEIGRSIGREAASSQLVRTLRSRWRALTRTPVPHPRVAVLEWTDPPILAGLWTPELIESAGGASVGARPGEPGTRVAWSELKALAPDLVVVAPCSYPVERTRREISSSLRIQRGLALLAPRRGVWIADEAHFSRPGPRILHGAELIEDLLADRPPRSPLPVETWRNLAPVVTH